MQFEYDPELLIEEIRKRPGIWDTKSVDYRIKKKRRKLWTEIVTTLNPTTANTCKSELRELEYQLQKKWKSMRDCFIKYIQNKKRTRRPYIYMKQLQFLIKDNEAAEKRGKDENADDSDGEQRLRWKRKSVVAVKMDTDVTDEENEDADDDVIEHDDTNDETYDVHIEQTPSQSTKPPVSQVNEFAFANVDAVLKRESDDPDRLFLLSLLPHLKTIPEEFRLNVKMELMQVLQNANYNTARDHKIL